MARSRGLGDVYKRQGFGSHNPEVQARHNERLGIIRKVAAQHGIQLQTFNPMTIKLFATGDGKAPKSEMVAACRRLLGINPTSDDEADAIWILHLTQRPDCWPQPKPKKPRKKSTPAKWNKANKLF
jgi:hypothetical protein